MDSKNAREELKYYNVMAIYEVVGVHFNTLNKFKRGGNIELDSYEKIVKFLTRKVGK